MENILNLTQHRSSEDQIKDGVIDNITPENVSSILTFNDIPSEEEMVKRANELVEIVQMHEKKLGFGINYVLIGGAPYFMRVLEEVLVNNNIQPLYSFTKRESVEKEVDGKVIKTNVFKHIGFVKGLESKYVSVLEDYNKASASGMIDYDPSLRDYYDGLLIVHDKKGGEV